MERKIIYLINPISGTRNKKKLIDIIEQKTQKYSIDFQVLTTDVTGDYSFLLKKIALEGITDVVICGGDGTVNQVLKALRHTAIKIGIIPMGSGNGLALAAKIPKNSCKALDIIFAGKYSDTDAFLINGTFSCMLSGMGLDAQIAHDFAKQHKRGLITYIKLAIKHFANAKPYPFEIINNNNFINTEAYFICIANGNQFGNHFTIAPKASLNDNLLDILVVKKVNKLKLIFMLLKHLRFGEVVTYQSVNFNTNDIFYFQSPKLVINNISNAPLHIDGDVAITAKQFDIEIIPAAFKLIIP